MLFRSSLKTNEIQKREFSAFAILIRQFKNPLLLVFIFSTIVSFAVGEKINAFVIWVIMTLSIFLGFWNEYQAEKVVNDLLKRVSFTVNVIRNGLEKKIKVKDIEIGDEVTLRPGSIIPADMKLISSEGLETNESVLTGESVPVLKKDGDMVFMGTTVTGGNAHCVVMVIGMDTKFGKISVSLGGAKPETEFQKGLRDFSSLLAKVAAVAVVVVISFGYFLHHPIVDTVLFALTVAMGITPELLPLIVTISLSYGAKKMAREDVVVKQLVSIEDLGNMEVLCTDKTGTLTEGKIHLTSYTDLNQKVSPEVLNLSLLCNSGFAHGHVSNDSIDEAIIEFVKEKNIKVSTSTKLIFENPFDFENRFMTVVAKNGEKLTLLCKGSPEAIIARCSLSDNQKLKCEKMVERMQLEGLRVVAVAGKNIKHFNEKLIKSEEIDLDLKGFITFADVPKIGLNEVFKKFENLGIAIKIITGDSEIVAEKIAKDAGFNFKNILVSSQISQMNDSQLSNEVWKTDIFAKVTPSQKMRIIEALKSGHHTIGFLGDGINDAPALHMADVGISVNTGVDVAKDAASIVLLRKSLGVIADGVEQGRRTFQNTIKYILMGTSSSFGNMVSAASASIILPFLPMTPIQFLLNNILYDLSQLSIPTDNVDTSEIIRPKSWDVDYIKRFMIIFGLIGTSYDFLTFAMMYFIFHARGSLFQTGWFVTSFITEVLVVFVIRTKKIPFWKSVPSNSFLITCFAVVAIAVYLPFSPLATYFGFIALPLLYFGFLIGITLTYLIFVETGKYFLNRRFLQ